MQKIEIYLCFYSSISLFISKQYLACNQDVYILVKFIWLLFNDLYRQLAARLTGYRYVH